MAGIQTKRLAAPAITLGVALFATSAGAFWHDRTGCGSECGHRGGNDFFDRCEEHAAENALWPAQYVDADRCRALAPFDVMIRNGWRRQNLLGSHHFNEDATKLTDSGKLRVQWILTQNPPAYRQVFVERSLEDGVTEARIAAANDFAAMVVSDGTEPAVTDTHLISDGRPATTVDFVNTTFRENMPIPALPQSSPAGGEISE